MEEQTVYQQLASHLSSLGRGYPITESLVEILKEIFSELEARVALAIPNKKIPLSPNRVEDILESLNIPREELIYILESMVTKGLLFTGPLENGEKGYALQQVGFGFPQAFFWKGEDTPQARETPAPSSPSRPLVTRSTFLPVIIDFHLSVGLRTCRCKI